MYREEIITLLQTKLVQTNEVRRCAYLYPSFSYIFNKVNKPLALIEMGQVLDYNYFGTNIAIRTVQMKRTEI